MKSNLRLFLTGLLLFSINLPESNAQNWAPLNRYEKMNFSLAGLNYISNTIWVDSAVVSGSDSIFYLSRIVTNCDTCLPNYKLCNQPDFLKKDMVKHEGGTYEFRHPGSVVLKTQASTGQSWLYDTANAITATVFSMYASTLFGINDSIKEIHLSDGGVLILSKHHGLVQFTGLPVSFVYSLRGIEGRNLGDMVPKFAEIYNYKVGDVFQYHFRYFNYGVGYGNEGFRKITILTRDSSFGYYNYSIRRITSQWTTDLIGHNGDTSHMYELTNINFTDSLLNLANYYPNQICEDPLDQGISGQNSGYFKVGPDEHGIYSKWMGNPGYNDNYLYHHASLATPPGPFELLVPDYGLMNANMFKPGLGNTMNSLVVFETTQLDELIGYVKNGDTVGTVYPDDFLLAGIPVNQNAGDLFIFPNPCRDRLNIGGLDPARTYSFRIIDLEGRELLQFSSGDLLNTSQLKSGIYILCIKDLSGQTTIRKKFIRE